MSQFFLNITNYHSTLKYLSFINHHTKDDDDKKIRKYDYPISPIFQSAFLTSRAKTAVKNSPHKIEMEQVVKHL